MLQCTGSHSVAESGTTGRVSTRDSRRESLSDLRTYVYGGLVVESGLTLATPWAAACQASLSMGFSWQGEWSELPFPSPGRLSHLGIKLGSPALQADSLLTELQGNSMEIIIAID